MAQKNIDFGTYPDDPDADAIRSAFQKTQENFNEIFAGLADQGVLSINKTPQAGITVSSPTGNVLITANLSCVTVQSNTLQLTINNGTPATTQIIDSASKILQINFPPLSNIPNANVAGNLSVGGWANIGNANVYVILQNGNITATGNIVAANGNFSGNLNVSGNIANANNIAVSNAIAGNTASFSGNLSAANLVTTGVANVGNLNVVSNVTSNLLPNANVTYNLGSSSQQWKDIFGNTLSIAANITAGNVNAGNLLSANFLSGTLTTNAQPNVTSVGTLITLTVSGNANVGNIGAEAGVFTSNITAGNVYANSGTVGALLLTGTLTTNAQPNITSVGTLGSLDVAANITSGNANLGNLAKANFFEGDGYLISNLSVAAGTYISNGTSNLAVTSSGGNVTVTVGATTNSVVFTSTGVNVAGYANIAGNANIGNVGATRFVGNLEGLVLTNAQTNITSLGTLTGLSVNGVSNLSAVGNVIITGGVANSFLMTNGSGNLTWNTATLIPAQGSNAQIIFNDGGNAYAGNTGFTFVKATGNVAIPGALDVIGNIAGANLSTAGRLAVTGNANVGNIGAGSGTFTSLIVNGAINAGNISGNVITGNSFVGNIAGANVTGQVGNALVAGTVYTAAQPNITSVGTLTSLGVNGTVTAVAFTANTGIFTGNGSGLTNLPAGNISGQVANALVAGTVYTAAQPNITSVGTLASLSVSGNANVGNVGATNGVFTNVSGNGAALTALNASNISSGTLAQARLANASVTLGNTALTLGSTVTTVTGLTSVTSTTFVGSLTGAATTAATVTTAAQPNITSVGTLSTVTVSGNVSAGNVIATGYHIRSVGTGISAAGTTQGTATALTKEFNQVTTVSSNQGVVLPTAVAGMAIVITNTSANSLNVYPASGAAINTLSANAAVTQAAGSTLQFVAMTSTQWYTVGATYA